jgi:surface antigen
VDDVPEAGSILVTQHGTWGHVAIVREANESEVYVEDANWYGDGGVHHHWLKRTESDRYIHLSW